MTRGKALLLSFTCCVFGTLFFWQGWRELAQRTELEAMSTASAVVSAIETRHVDKFIHTIVRGNFTSGDILRTFSTTWGVRLPPREIPAVGSTVAIRFDPRRPDHVRPDKPWDGLARVLFDFGATLLFALGAAVCVVFSVNPAAFKSPRRKRRKR
jgi:hypothetical protein